MKAIVDCNSFYCSCERLFQPRLLHHPVVVLSNNDGCVIARSDEAKKLGIAMGVPFFEARSLIHQHNIAVFSSNYNLYGDLSWRVMETLRKFAGDEQVEVYSVDEAFIDLGEVDPEQLERTAREMRVRVEKWTGIPVSIGIGPTKTLAKIANRIAKKTPELGGVLDLGLVRDVDELLARLPCEDIWGIGKRLAIRLAAGGIRTACDLKHGEAAWVRKTLGVVGERIRLELQGVSCLALEEVPAPKKGIASAKSFGRPVESLRELEEALATYTARAAEKLRSGRLLARQVHVFVATNPFSARQPQYSAAAQTALVRPSNHTPDLIAAALELLREIYRPGHQYKKTGIFVTDLIAESDLQPDLFDAAPEAAGRVRELDQIVDGLNRKLGRNAIRYGSMGVKSRWAL
mgnify:CR=1 FL=1